MNQVVIILPLLVVINMVLVGGLLATPNAEGQGEKENGVGKPLKKSDCVQAGENQAPNSELWHCPEGFYIHGVPTQID